MEQELNIFQHCFENETLHIQEQVKLTYFMYLNEQVKVTYFMHLNCRMDLQNILLT
jgi:hypothetical protein